MDIRLYGVRSNLNLRSRGAAALALWRSRARGTEQLQEATEGAKPVKCEGAEVQTPEARIDHGVGEYQGGR